MPRDTVRLIGGLWRSRLLKFPEKSSIRPTSARVRETVFNWLSSEVQDAVCLDAFSGSGALGFEALSRGARWVYFIDQSPQIVNYLKQQLTIFSAQEKAYVHLGKFLPAARHFTRLTAKQELYSRSRPNIGREAERTGRTRASQSLFNNELEQKTTFRSRSTLLDFLKNQSPSPFTIVFLDPPFYQGLVLPYVQQLEMSGVLSDIAWIYIEHERNLKEANFPKNWKLLKSKKTSQVHYSLWQRNTK